MFFALVSLVCLAWRTLVVSRVRRAGPDRSTPIEAAGNPAPARPRSDISRESGTSPPLQPNRTDDQGPHPASVDRPVRAGQHPSGSGRLLVLPRGSGPDLRAQARGT